MDIFTIAKIRSLSKKQRRIRRDKFENKFNNESFTDQLQEKEKRDEMKNRQDKINDLIQDIKALQMISEAQAARGGVGDVKSALAIADVKKHTLNDILKGNKL